MNISAPFISRPVATTLLTIAVALAGAIAFNILPVAPLPQVDFPTIAVSATLPGASAQIMASSVATPLERQFGHIAGITEMTSSSSLGNTSVTLQFDLSRNIDGAARDVEAAINAARTYLPTNLPQNPFYRKVNPADSPIMILSLTSEKYDVPHLYDMASTILEQKLSQIQGVGQVIVGGGAAPAVRVEANPTKLESNGLTLADIKSVLTLQNAHEPRGQMANKVLTADIITNDQISRADDYKPLVVGYHNGAAVHLSDVADVVNGAQDLRAAGYTNGTKSVTILIFRQPGANIIDTVGRIDAQLPFLKAVLPQGIQFNIVLDRTTTIRASVHDVEMTLILSVCLVVAVVFIFLRSAHATVIPAVAVPVSLIGTFAVMYLCGFSLDNLSLMALTIATGFVVDDAIVVMENITRHVESGIGPVEAALKGSQEIGFTVLSISISLVAVFIPILLMGGIVGRLFREFAITLSGAIVVSMVISLTTTSSMCAHILKPQSRTRNHGYAYRISECAFNGMLSAYRRSLSWALEHSWLMLMVLALTIALNLILIVKIPKGFFPQQDTGALMGGVQGPQDASFQFTNYSIVEMEKIIKADPAVAYVNGYTGGGRGATNSAFLYIALKPLSERKASAMQIINRLRPRLNRLPIASVFFQPVQDLRIGGRASNALYQYTLQADNFKDLVHWGPILLANMKKLRTLQDVNSDQQNGGLEEMLTYDRVTAARLGQTAESLDNALYSAFGQSEASVIYTQLNQYYVVLEVAPQYWQSPAGLKNIYIRPTTATSEAGADTMAPLATLTTSHTGTTPLQVNHTGVFPSVTISFNLPPGIAMSQATAAIQQMEERLGLPSTIHGFFAGTLQAYQQSLSTEPILILTALLAVYIVLGILYESVVHPLTIISTLPSASVGAMVSLMLFHMDLNIMSIIGIVLLIGIVKKNAIMMIDFALAAERQEGKSTAEAIFEACMLRFRPIMMTTMAAIFGALPLAFGTGIGSELRRPLGITIVGGLLLSQLITLYTTPVVYLALDRLRLRAAGKDRDTFTPALEGSAS
ncbi:MAG TPA: efflux RND transporter permease subunit [Bryobacteraceae bacterium]|nr:efflux RND transporter permease subunit [Bryobacteraceae bacterium]